MAKMINLICEYSECFKIENCYFKKRTFLKWKTLKDLYSVNPERWKYEEYDKWKRNSYLSYNANEDCSKNKDKIVQIQLSFVDFLKLKWFASRNQGFSSPGTELLLTTVQEDIDELRKRSEKQIQESLQIMDEIKLEIEK